MRRKKISLSGYEHAYRGWHMVVLHPDHHLVVHRESGGFPYGGKNDQSDRERRRSRQSDGYRIRNSR